MTRPPQPSAPSSIAVVPASKSVASALLIVALFVFAFSNIKSGAQLVQATGVGLFLAAALIGAIRAPHTMPRLNPFELTMLGSVALSAVVCLTRSSEIAAIYTITLPLVVFAASLLVRVFSLEELFFLAAKAQALICIVVVPVHWRKILVALNPRSADRWMLRLTPFEMHPNLVGFAYGIGALVATYAAIRSKGTWRLIYSCAAAASAALILGASARAGLLALAASAGVILLISYPKLPRHWKLATIASVVLAVLISMLYWARIYEYLEVLLELNSNTRGFGSGGTGRTDAWARGIDTITGSGVQLFFGSGLRSTSYEELGFYTENSYINIIIESGILFGGALIFLVLSGILKTLIRARKSHPVNWTLYAMVSVTIFAAVQSFFNRYLIGVGNYGSIFLILLYSYAWLPSRTLTIARSAPIASRHPVAR